MDAFYASVEQRDNPQLKGLPVVVGAPEGRGVVLTASYEARKFGVRSAMPGREAKRLCPQAVFVPPRFPAYKEASRIVREIFHRFTDLVEPLSLDEAYLDVTEDKMKIGSALEIAKEIKRLIREETQLTASAGVSVNKFVAKVASGMQKPDGITFIHPSKVEAFMETLAVRDFFGVGKKTAERMNELGFFTGADLKKLSREELVSHFGKSGHFYYKIVRGIDDRPVESERETKSVSVENTFSEDVLDVSALQEELTQLAENLLRRVEKYQLYGRTVTVKVKYHDFKQVTRSKTLPKKVREKEILLQTAFELLQLTEAGQKKIRLLGIGLSGFEEEEDHRKKNGQLELF
ncbi:MAG: nucleotidyltransferase/DNA polymerase involved in DNA repair [Bacteroidetes bacterium]|nr:MAG: nucleotidyltransferase/DNA polymerase involved in DNA repair [Bacteroidota bacterium]